MTGGANRARTSDGRLASALALLLAVLVAGCGPAAESDSGPTPVATTSVDLPKSYRFEPAAISVPAGSTVTWTNRDDFTHTVTLEGSEPLTMSPGQSATHTFTTPGLYPYVCSLHPGDMMGSVVVEGR
jgi:plastocyanin